MPEIITPMEKQAVYAEGKKAFVDGKRRGYNRIEQEIRNSRLYGGWVGTKPRRTAKETSERSPFDERPI